MSTPARATQLFFFTEILRLPTYGATSFRTSASTADAWLQILSAWDSPESHRRVRIGLLITRVISTPGWKLSFNQCDGRILGRLPACSARCAQATASR